MRNGKDSKLLNLLASEFVFNLKDKFLSFMSHNFQFHYVGSSYLHSHTHETWKHIQCISCTNDSDTNNESQVQVPAGVNS
jgi:hypothetical protein